MNYQVGELAADIRLFMEKHQNPVVVQKYSRYFVEGYDAFGVENHVLVEQKKKWLDDYRIEFRLDGFLELGDRLVAGGKYEEVFLAYWFVQQFPDYLSGPVFPRLAAWLEHGICNWPWLIHFPWIWLRRFSLKGWSVWIT